MPSSSSARSSTPNSEVIVLDANKSTPPQISKKKRRHVETPSKSPRRQQTMAKQMAVPELEALVLRTRSSDTWKAYDLAIRKDAPHQTIWMDWTCKICKTLTKAFPIDKKGGMTNVLERHTAACSRLNPDDAIELRNGDGLAPPYDPLHHRVLLCRRFFANPTRPYLMVEDEAYREEVEYLSPKAMKPDRHVVAADMIILAGAIKARAKTYLDDLEYKIHIQVDGWTSPLQLGSLGASACFYDAASRKMVTVKLDMIPITAAHTGEHLASKLFQMTEEYGITAKVLNIIMDNASNCDTTALHYASLAATKGSNFHGKRNRGRCFAHCLNLMAKAYLSSFFSKNDTSLTAGSAAEDEIFEDVEISDVDGGCALPDAGREQDDDSVISDLDNLLVGRFLWWPPASEQQKYKLILNKVFRLSALIVNVDTRAVKFGAMVDAHRKALALRGEAKDFTNARRPIKRIVTRWNSEYSCIQRYLDLREPLRQYCLDGNNNCEQYKLDKNEIIFLEQLLEALEPLKLLTDRFQKQNAVLLPSVIPQFEVLEAKYLFYRDDRTKPPILRMAAHKALEVIGKYYAKHDDCDAYRVSLLLDPRNKLDWTVDNNWPEEWQKGARELVEEIWHRDYAHEELEQRPGTESQAAADYDSDDSDFFFQSQSSDRPKAPPEDELQRFWRESRVDRSVIKRSQSVLNWWVSQFSTYPRLSRMAIDYLSTPATSVDVERMFSYGRLTVNNLQTSMSVATFRAKNVPGSWAKFLDYKPHQMVGDLTAELAKQKAAEAGDL